jgi:hypothetical protein
MGEGDPRQTKHPSAREPARPPTDRTPPGAPPSVASGPAAAPPPAPKAAGTVPPATRRAPASRTQIIATRASAVQKLASEPPQSRTVTLDDPLTTSLLAEVTRRSRTIDVSPEQIDEAIDLAPGPGDHDPDDSI